MPSATPAVLAGMMEAASPACAALGAAQPYSMPACLLGLCCRGLHGPRFDPGFGEEAQPASSMYIRPSYGSEVCGWGGAGGWSHPHCCWLLSWGVVPRLLASPELMQDDACLPVPATLADAACWLRLLCVAAWCSSLSWLPAVEAASAARSGAAAAAAAACTARRSRRGATAALP